MKLQLQCVVSKSMHTGLLFYLTMASFLYFYFMWVSYFVSLLGAKTLPIIHMEEFWYLPFFLNMYITRFFSLKEIFHAQDCESNCF